MLKKATISFFYYSSFKMSLIELRCECQLLSHPYNDHTYTYLLCIPHYSIHMNTHTATDCACNYNSLNKFLIPSSTCHQRSLGAYGAYVNYAHTYTYMTQIRDDSTFTSFGVTKKLKYIDHNFFAFEAEDLILTVSKNSAITDL